MPRYVSFGTITLRLPDTFRLLWMCLNKIDLKVLYFKNLLKSRTEESHVSYANSVQQKTLESTHQELSFEWSHL